MTRIKLCGMMRESDIETVNRLKVDYVGFVFAKKSKRCVTPELAKTLKERLDPSIRSVGVFVDEEKKLVSGLLREGIIDLAQLHGSESDAYVVDLKKISEKPVIRAFRVKSAADLSEAAECSADYILLDAGAGDGEVFDWEILKGFDRPFFLAGGLCPENVSEAVRRIRPFGVDVSSGIETDGKKDSEKMKSFTEAVRNADLDRRL